MKINLNDKMDIGFDTLSKDGERQFGRIATSENKEFFVKVIQYLYDEVSNMDDLVVIHIPTETVFKFEGFVKALGLKSKRR